MEAVPPAPPKHPIKSRNPRKGLWDFAFQEKRLPRASSDLLGHNAFLLVKMLVNFLPTHTERNFTNMGKINDTQLRAMKPNGKIRT